VSEKELRYIPTTEVRVSADGKKIEGYASVFNVHAQLPGFVEVVRPGAFSRSIRDKSDVVCLWNHSVNHPLGRVASGTLQLFQDSKGLRYVCDLPNTSYAKDVHELIRTRTVSGCSFAFKIPNADAQKWSEGRAADGTYFIQRDINDVDLLDVSPVTNPCYSGTNVDARAVTAVPAEIRSAVDTKNAGRIVVPTLEPDIEEKFRRLGLLRLAYMD
jgi:uncharacterized protein